MAAVYVPTIKGLLGQYNVLKFGAKGDGTTDDTAAFQAAIDAAALVANGGGIIVQVPAKNYYFAGTLNLKAGVTLKGSWNSPHCSGGNAYCSDYPGHYVIGGGPLDQTKYISSPTGGGTTLMVTAGANNATGTPFITMNTNSCVEGLKIFYPNQPLTGANSGTPTPYPYAIKMIEGINASVINVDLVNSYQGIWCEGMWRPTIRGIYGQPYLSGLFVNHCYDVSQISAVHWECNYDAKLNGAGDFNHPWTLANGTGFRFYRCDLTTLDHLFCYCYRNGFVFDSYDTTSSNATAALNGAWASINDCHADGCAYGVVVIRSQIYGLSFNGCGFTFGSLRAMEIRATNIGNIRITGGYYTSIDALVIDNAGSGALTIGGGANLQGTNSSTNPIIRATAGRLNVTGNIFLTDQPQVQLGSGVEAAIVTSNIFKGSQRITNAMSAGTFITTGNVGV